MKWVRSYVGSLEETMKTADATKRGFVYDPTQCEPVFIQGYNYWDMFNEADDDIILIEWDTALSYEDRRLFEGHCRANNKVPHVAPYKHYVYKNRWQRVGWVHRNSTMCFVHEGDPYAFYVGFGLVYLPLQVMKDCVDAVKNRMLVKDDRDRDFVLGIPQGEDRENSVTENLITDCTFSFWHATTTRQPIQIHWDVRPVHLHYEVPISIPSEPRRPDVAGPTG